MVSYESIPQFTNQLAYQSVFAPPGFSFESPFTYPMISQPTQPTQLGSGNGMEDQKQQLQQQQQQQASGPTDSMPMSRPQHNMGMDMDTMNSGSGSSSGPSGYTGGHGLPQGQSQGQGSGSGINESTAMGSQGGMVGMGDLWKSAAWSASENGDKMASTGLQYVSSLVHILKNSHFSTDRHLAICSLHLLSDSIRETGSLNCSIRN